MTKTSLVRGELGSSLPRAVLASQSDSRMQGTEMTLNWQWNDKSQQGVIGSVSVFTKKTA